MRLITQARLKELLTYEPTTGIFRWRVPKGRAKPGDQAGCVNGMGTRYMELEQRQYVARRLAQLYMTGEWPEGRMKPRNGDPDDLRWANLSDEQP